mmetsp:Transcript_46138/g.116183  ORF Transcript_46138/g.116183 Transcript_46138/m.116183 type:complete len:206 (-) Transcript_46138:55-672(-)
MWVVFGAVRLAIEVAQLTQTSGTALRRELTVKNERRAMAGLCRTQEDLTHTLQTRHRESTAEVASLVLVVVATVQHDHTIEQSRELVAQKTDHDLTSDVPQIGLLTSDRGQQRFRFLHLHRSGQSTKIVARARGLVHEADVTIGTSAECLTIGRVPTRTSKLALDLAKVGRRLHQRATFDQMTRVLGTSGARRRCQLTETQTLLR